MKTEDLMIGDWVRQKHSGLRLQVSEIHPPYILAECKEGQFREDTIESIPLTLEILEKNGIKLFSTYTHPYRDCDWEEGELEEAKKHYPMHVYQTSNNYITFVIRPNEQELKVYSSNYKTRVEKKEEVIFVHEFQHALKLCRIEKEIVL